MVESKRNLPRSKSSEQPSQPQRQVELAGQLGGEIDVYEDEIEFDCYV